MKKILEDILALGIELHTIFIYSEDNIADCPSRRDAWKRLATKRLGNFSVEATSTRGSTKEICVLPLETLQTFRNAKNCNSKPNPVQDNRA